MPTETYTCQSASTEFPVSTGWGQVRWKSGWFPHGTSGRPQKAGALGGTTPPTRHLRYYHIIPGPYSQSLCLPPASSSLPDLSCVPPFPACSPSCPGLLRLPSSSQRFHPLPPQTLQGLVFSQALLQVASSVAGQTHSPTGARGFASRPRAMGYHLSVGEGGDTPKSLLLGL